MAYSGIIKDPNSEFGPPSSFPLRAVGCVLIALGMGWGFTTYAPQISDMAGRVGLGLFLAIILVLLTTNVSVSRGERTFTALLMGAAFATGMWGLWVQDTFGRVPTLNELRSALGGQTFNFQVFGNPVSITSYSFEIWAGITGAFAAAPLLMSFAKPRDGEISRSNPFVIHPDFAQPFVGKLVVLSALSFALAGAAVYAVPYLEQYSIPIESAVLPPLVLIYLFAKLHMTFLKAIAVSAAGGVAAAAGFWLPWHYLKFGQEQTIAFVKSGPDAIMSQISTFASGASYPSNLFGTELNYGPWTVEIWVALTATYLCMPLLVTLLRRAAAMIRLS